MTIPSAQELTRHLTAYSTHVDTWNPEDIDTFLMLGFREWLEAHKDQLSTAQRGQLAERDAQVLSLLNGDYGDEAADEMATLQFVADVINGKPSPESA